MSEERIGVSALERLRFVSNPSFSPDGRYIAFAVQRADVQKNGYQGSVYVYDVKDGGVHPVWRDGADYLWTAGNTLLCRVNAGEGQTALEEIEPDEGRSIRRLEIPLGVRQLCETAGDWLLITAAEQRKEGVQNEDCQVLDELPFWANGRGVTNGLRTRLYAYGLRTGELVRISEESAEVGMISVRGHRVLYKAEPWTDVRTMHDGIYLYDLSTGEGRCLLAPGIRRTGLIGLWDDDEAVVASAEDCAYSDGKYPDFYTLNLEDGTLKGLAGYDFPSGEGTIGTDARYGAGRTVKAGEGICYFTTVRGGSACLWAICRDGTFRQLEEREGACDSFDVRGGHAVVCGFYGGQPAELYLDGRQITHLNDIRQVSAPVPLHFTASDGYEIQGWVMEPVGRAEGRRYPGILHIHGGPHASFGGIFYHEMQVWASAGYYVFFANPRGSSGYGTEFADVSGRLGDVDFKNLMEFTDEVLRRHPDIDAQRLAVTGISYGGYMTNWICGHTSRFRAAVAQCSIASWISIEHMSDIGYAFNKDNVSVWTREDAGKVWEQSPLRYAAGCRTPTLLIHCDEDYRTPLAEGIQMFTALKLSGTETRLCIFHGENHGISRNGKPKNRLRRMEEILCWMDRHLR